MLLEVFYLKNKNDSKMIRVAVKFWTNNTGTRDKKVAWESGTAYLYANKSKGIVQQFERFETLGDMPKAVKTVLKKGGIKLRPTSKNFVEL